MAGVGKLLKQAQKMQKAMEAVQTELANTTVEGSAAGGAVKAVVNGQGKLFNGMNIRVNVHRSLGEQLVVPKSSVVLRSGKQVIFTLKDNKAKWNYVQTVLENSDEYTIVEDEVQEGDVVIVTGNVNLAHEAPVKVIENKK